VSAARRRVLVVAWWYPTPDDPVPGAFVREQARLVAADHDVTVLAFQRGEGRPGVRIADGEEDGLRVLRVVHAAPGPLAPAAYVPGALAAVRRARLRPDLVHAHVFMGGAIGALIARRRVPLVVSEHYSGFQLGTLSAIERAVARTAFRAAAVVAPVSEALAAAVRPYAPAGRVRVVPNVVDTATFAPAPSGARSEAPRILYVGNMEDVKGVAHLLRAFAELRRKRPDVTLELIGDGTRRAEYEALAATLRLDARFAGRVAKADVARAMRQADLLAVPSATETFGLVAAEALACALPVVASRVGALPEIVTAEAGVLVAPADPAALAAGLDDALERRDALAGEAAAARIRARFGPDAVGAAWRAVYDDALASAGSRPGT
jgi:glycosyltransferase involved in cell wall biosynthesis